MIKQFLKFFFFISLTLLLVLNWKNIYWIFNYRAVAALTYNFFNPYPESKVLAQLRGGEKLIENLPSLAPLDIQSLQINIQPKEKVDPIIPNLPENNFLQIPKIDILVPVVISESDNIDVLKKYLDMGVVYHPYSVLPGNVGQTMLLGHSAPENWPRIKYDWVFNDLNNLVIGDEIILNFGNKNYTYKVKRKDIIEKGAEIKSDSVSQKTNILILISCWPPGKDYKRITVQAELI